MAGSVDSSLLGPSVSIISIYVLSLVFYRLYLHPLAKFPGPKLAAITRYYEAYFDVVQNGQYTFKIAELHKRYGPIVRISPHELHINDPSFYEKLYRQDGHWNKYEWSYDAFGAPSSAICTIDHNLHKLRRVPLNAYFSKAKVASQQSLIQTKVTKLCDRIERLAESKRTFNLGAAFSATSTDVVTEYILGRSYNNLDREDFGENLMNMLQGSGGMWRMTKHVRFLGPLMKAMPLSMLEKMGDPDVKAFVAFLETSKFQTQQIMAQITSHPTNELRTIVHEILDSDHLPPSEKRYNRVSDEVDTITGAGLETVAQTLRFTVYNLYNNQDILQRLRAELRNILPPGSGHSPEAAQQNTNTLSLTQLERLPYLTAVITEGLRLSPGLATRLARVAPDRELVYNDNWVIPRGTPVGMTTLLLHWDERVYPDGRLFKPERWLERVGGQGGEEEDRVKREEKTFAPFSRGTRICLGMHLAWAELYITLATLVSRFDFEFIGTGPEDVEPDSDQFIIGTKRKKGFIARATMYQI